MLRLAAIIFIMLITAANAAIWNVGPTRNYKMPSQVAGFVGDWDTVYFDQGTYFGDAAIWRKNNLVLACPSGIARMVSGGVVAESKAIWVIKGNNTTIRNIEFSGASVPDKNGAGIRQEGTNLTVIGCSFFDNEDGILAGANSNSNIFITHSTFARNGYGDGYSHNMYINKVQSFTLQFCYVHHAKVGHNVKSRAMKNIITYNCIMDETTGNSSMLLDLPNGGISYVIGNLFMQGVNAENGKMITFGSEGYSNPVNKLFLVNNTLVNERQNATFIFAAPGAAEIKIYNNAFAGIAKFDFGQADFNGNLTINDPATAGFVDLDNNDYRLRQNSPLIDAGIDPGSGDDLSLRPVYSFKHPADSAGRSKDAVFDVGAYEYSVPGDVADRQNDVENFNFPNPFNAYTIIKFNNFEELDFPLKVMIFDERGCLADTRFVENANNREITIVRNALPNGIYTYKVYDASGKNVAGGKFVIN